jgi:hypothetical protein
MGSMINSLAGQAGENLGLSDFARDRFQAAFAQDAMADAVMPGIRDVSHIKDFQTLVDFTTGMAGQGLATSIPALGLALGLRRPIAGVFAGSAPLEAGEQVRTLRADPLVARQDILGNALVKGVIAGGIETAGGAPGQVARRILAPGRASGGIVKGTARATVGEALTEGAQNVTGQVLHQELNPKKELDPGSVLTDIAAGAAGGAAIGGAGSVVASIPGGIARTAEELRNRLDNQRAPLDPDGEPAGIAEGATVADILPQLEAQEGEAATAYGTEDLDEQRGMFRKARDEFAKTRTMPLTDRLLKSARAALQPQESAAGRKKSLLRTPVDDDILDEMNRVLPLEMSEIGPDRAQQLSHLVGRLAASQNVLDTAMGKAAEEEMQELMGARYKEVMQFAVDRVNATAKVRGAERKKLDKRTRERQIVDDRQVRQIENVLRTYGRGEYTTDKEKRQVVLDLAPRLLSLLKGQMRKQEGLGLTEKGADFEAARGAAAAWDKRLFDALEEAVGLEKAPLVFAQLQDAVRERPITSERAYQAAREVPESDEPAAVAEEGETPPQLKPEHPQADARLGVPMPMVKARQVMRGLQSEVSRKSMVYKTKEVPGQPGIFTIEGEPADTADLDESAWNRVRESPPKDDAPQEEKQRYKNKSGFKNSIMTVESYTPKSDGSGLAKVENKINIRRGVAEMMRREGQQTQEGGTKYVLDMFSRFMASLTTAKVTDPSTGEQVQRFRGIKARNADGTWDIPDDTPISKLHGRMYHYGEIKEAFFGQSRQVRSLRADVAVAKKAGDPEAVKKAQKGVSDYYAGIAEVRERVDVMENDAMDALTTEDAETATAPLLARFNELAESERAQAEKAIGPVKVSKGATPAAVERAIAARKKELAEVGGGLEGRFIRTAIRRVEAEAERRDKLLEEGEQAGTPDDPDFMKSETMKGQTPAGIRKSQEGTNLPVGGNLPAAGPAGPTPDVKAGPVKDRLRLLKDMERLARLKPEEVQDLEDVYPDFDQARFPLPKFSTMNVGRGPVTAEQQKEAEEHIKKVLGDKVGVKFIAAMDAEGEFAKLKGVEVVSIAANAVEPMSVAYHEALHALVARLSEASPTAKSVLFRAASAPHIVAKLRELLAKHPDALLQITAEGQKELARRDGDVLTDAQAEAEAVEERLAYMYQFWASGKKGLMRIGPQTETWFDKIKWFFRRVAATWAGYGSDALAVEKTGDILRAFHKGYFANPSTVAQVMEERFPRDAQERMEKLMPWYGQLLDKFVYTTTGAVRAIGAPELNWVMDNFYTDMGAQGQKPGYRQERHAIFNETMNRMFKILKPLTEPKRKEVLDELRSGKPRTSAPALAIEGELKGMLKYMRDSGVKVLARDENGKWDYRPIKEVERYFPRVPDLEYMRTPKGKEKFIELLEKYKVPKPEEVYDNYTKGVEAGSPRTDDLALGLTFFAPHTNERTLAFIPDKELAPFLNKDLVGTLIQYTARTVRRAEYTRRFGNSGEKIREARVAAEKAHGLNPRQLETFDEAVAAMEGTLGANMSDEMKALYGAMMTYQNIRLLPLALFSSLVDPLGIVVRGGTFYEAGKAMARGLRDLVSEKRDKAFDLAAAVGAINAAVDLELMHDMYNSQYMPKTQQIINDKFFKYNGMESWNRSMRVAASAAAEQFIIRHTKKPNEHSDRYLKELNLKPEDVVLNRGRIVLNAKTKQAINLWVDQAILRPDAALRPAYMSDPHWMLVSHLKQYMYLYQKTIIARVAHEFEQGNYTPAYALMAYVPMIIASDMLRILLTPGGADDEARKNWGTAEWMSRGVQRAGIFGPSQMAIDAHADLGFGKFGIESLAGPSVQQLLDFLRASAQGGTYKELTKAIPGERLFR